jgi:diguanylate cyclase (GGDEF)-like protein
MGTVQVVQPDQGAELQLALLGPGELLGEMALLDDAPRSASAKALGEVETLVLDKADFHTLVLDRPDVALRLLEVMSRRIRRADEQISRMGRETLRDALSGLMNRLAFDERLVAETARARRYGSAFSILLVDLEDFEGIRDRFGAPVADRLVAWVGRLLHEHTRTSDVQFRLEGDMFALLCPSTPSDAIGRLALRLATLVAEAKPPVDEDVPVSILAGTATCPDHAADAPALYQRARQSLRAAVDL